MITVQQARPTIENEKGRIEITPAAPVAVLSWGAWTFRWTLGFDVQPGGGMDIILVPRFPTNRWSLPQVADPTAPGYVTARAGDGVLVSVDVLRWPLLQKPHRATVHIIQVGVGGRTLDKGEAIEVTYGDQRGGSLGAQVQMSAREVAFPVFVSSGQEPKFLERFVSWGRQTDVAALRAQSDFNPSLQVVGGRAAAFHLVAPMEIEPAAPFALRLAVLDQACNAAADYKGTVELRATDAEATLPNGVPVTGAKAVMSGLALHTPGFQRLYAIDPDRGLLGVSNPIRVRPGAQSIYWGEIHGHSEQSDGNGTPDEHYTYARDVALLDFAAVTDHDKELEAHPERWELAQAKAVQHTREGEFVALLGYEIGTRLPGVSKTSGDMNAYYLNSEGDMLGPLNLPLTPDVVRGRGVLLVPHTPLYAPEVGMGTSWEKLAEMPPDLMPLVEVFSTHGNSEYYDCPRHVLWQGEGQSVIDALKMGFRIGFIGSSDYHEVLTGSLLRIQDTPRTVNHAHMQARGGLAGVLASGLTRAGLFEAMQARRTFATSGIRGYADFAINGCGMGEVVTVASADAPRQIAVAVAAPERIVKAEIIRNGEVFADLADGQWYVETAMEDSDPIPDGAFYYLRATTERTDFVWSSPIWVDIAGSKRAGA